MMRLLDIKLCDRYAMEELLGAAMYSEHKIGTTKMGILEGIYQAKCRENHRGAPEYWHMLSE
jgi:hypothetical protein